MRVIGLDVGDKNMGVAISDAMGLTAQGIKTVSRKDCIEALKKIIEEYEVGSIVVGIPKMLDGTMGIQGEKVMKFIKEELKVAIPLPVILWDERLSTVSAERVLLEADLSRKKRKRLRDRVSAAVILQNYLDSRRR
jgi:putative Holliday junction resolvase